MGTTASCSNGEPLPSDALDSSSSLRHTNNYTHSGRDSHTEPSDPPQSGSGLHQAAFVPHRDYMRTLNTIQRQQDELAELTKQLQQRDQELRLVRDLRTREEPATLDESVKLRDLMIRKLEEDAERGKADLAKQKSRYKRKSRELITQLAEVKQSTTIRIMELRQEVHQLSLENRQLKERLGLSETALVSSGTPRPAQPQPSAAPPEAAGEASGSKTLIVELSSQLSDQADQLRRLRRQLQERDARIAQLAAPATSSTPAGVGAIKRQPLTKPKLPPAAERLNSELSFASEVSASAAGDDGEEADAIDSSRGGGGGDADSIYSDDTLLFVEMQQQQQQGEAAGGGGSIGVRGIIFDSYKQRTIDKLLQD